MGRYICPDSLLIKSMHAATKESTVDQMLYILYYNCSLKTQKNGKYISWKHIEDLFGKDHESPNLGFSLCHKLTRRHLCLTSFSKMKVNLAAQVSYNLLLSVTRYNIAKFF